VEVAGSDLLTLEAGQCVLKFTHAYGPAGYMDQVHFSRVTTSPEDLVAQR
jgi:hypothetical protein